MIWIWLISHPAGLKTMYALQLVIFQIIGKIEKGARNEGVDGEQGGKEECKLHSEE